VALYRSLTVINFNIFSNFLPLLSLAQRHKTQTSRPAIYRLQHRLTEKTKFELKIHNKTSVLPYIHTSKFKAKLSHYICGNKMPTRCNSSFYCSSYSLLNTFRVLLCPSSGLQVYYTVVAACGI